MPAYAYRAKRGPEKTVRGTIDAPDRDQAVARLHAMGYSLLALRESRGRGLGRGGPRVGVGERAAFWRQLAALLRAGLPLVTALSTIEQQSEGRRMRRVVGELARQVEHASSFSEALGRFPQAFGPVCVSVAATGEATGKLGQVAEGLADRLEKEQDLRGRLRSALAYPMFLCVVGGVVVSVLVTAVIPRFSVFFASYGQDLPLPTRALLAVSRFAERYGLFAAAAALAVTVVLYRATRRGQGRLVLDGMLLRVPVFGKVLRKSEMARFAHTFGLLCGSGVHILSALQITARSVTNRAVAREVEQARESVSRGSRLATALRQGRHFPPALVNMVAVGEESASLHEMLGNMAGFYEREVERATTTLTRMLESVLIVALACVVAVVVAAVLLPIFRASALLG